jgi:diacylglycerol kinase (ATP)|tara:strand:+ start:115 stop:477 length:363 start_codon:yes stop_codon:yes gene_type:complete
MSKPKYSFIKNTKYALSGLKDMILTEKSFRIELILFLILNFIVFILPFKFNYKIILSLSLFIPLFSEIINSAIERVVDLYTTEYNELAKKAKDIGAFLVLLSFMVTIFIWIVIISINLNS